MKPAPQGWPRISSSVYYEDPAKAIDWLCEVFGFEVQLKVVGENGRIEHSELVFGGGLVMVGGTVVEKPGYPSRRAPTEIGGANTQNMMVFVDDVEAHCAHARKHGAKIVVEPKTSDYGEEYWTDRSYEVEDLGGHHWWFVQRLRDQKPKS